MPSKKSMLITAVIAAVVLFAYNKVPQLRSILGG